jgi:hypothetical protein
MEEINLKEKLRVKRKQSEEGKKGIFLIIFRIFE